MGSDYQRTSGAPFFILADSGFTSKDEARLRVEGEPQVFAEYSGLDVVVYRVPQPLTFLARQQDLHRIAVDGDYAGEGLSNALAYLSDKWIKKSRMLWQQLFASRVRAAVVAAVPALHQTSRYDFGPTFESMPQFRPLKQFEFVERFRYPVHQAAPIGPPQGVQLAGSSSNFAPPSPGNVYVPLGKLKPGLYFVEAYVGAHRATTAVFVADTIAVTKVAGDGMLVWTADKTSGNAVPDVDIVWSDGAGTLKSDTTDRRGLGLLAHAAPQKSWVVGRDRAGGVFVSENFYYDSEIYDRKFYIFTDRPLYKPGDQVKVKVYGRAFVNARESHAVEPVKATLDLIDAAGQTLLTRNVAIDPTIGGDFALPLPDNAYLGGYELRLRYRNATYAGSFRVANYARPHYEVDVSFDRPDIRAGEPVNGHISAHYPDGAPVAGAQVSLSLKSQALSMVDGDARAGGRFPVKLAEQSLTLGDGGSVAFTLPVAAVPSRYILGVQATQQGTFPVAAHAELLLQAAAATLTLRPAETKDASAARFHLEGASAAATAGTTWEAIRLEDRSRVEGSVAAGASDFAATLPGPGNYSVFVRDAKGTLLAQTGYALADTGAAERGGIRVRADKTSYRVGDTAQVDIDFPRDPGEALLTLERDRVERYAIAGTGEDWLRVNRLQARHWRVSVPITEDLGPNVTFSVLSVGAGNYEFQNAGIVVEQPRVDVAIATAKPDYRPGEKVEVTLTAKVGDAPAAEATLTAGVVDEMVYVLQPEIAPSIFDFFYHPRRDSVRTTSSLNFFGYDLAWAPLAAQTGSFDYRSRVTKIPLRSRREELDTAAWEPTLRTDKDGKAHFSFVMPDALTRWRVTVRAMSSAGVAGQALSHLTSSQPVHLRWTGPTRFRSGDKPVVGVVAFNATSAPVHATLQVTAIEADSPQRELVLQPGSNYVELHLAPARDTLVGLTLSDPGKVYDKLDVALSVDAAGWASAHAVEVEAGAALALPADARDVRLRPASTLGDLYADVAGDLIDYPYGCVEQTASRLIPLALGLDTLGDAVTAVPLKLRLQQRIQTARGRLMALAGPKAQFTWWGEPARTAPGVVDANLLLTVYAYYADWRASRSLKIELPATQWQRVVDVYAAQAKSASLLHRALAIEMMQEMGLPVQTLLRGIAEELAKTDDAAPSALGDARDSMVLGGGRGIDLALVLWRATSARAKEPLDGALAERATQARTRLAALGPLPELLVAGLSEAPDLTRVQALLQKVAPDYPTLERALALAWLHDAVARVPGNAAPALALRPQWAAQDDGSYAWHGEELPTQVELGAGATPGAKLRVTYSSAQGEAGKLSATVERRLLKLEPADELGHYTASVATGPLEANALYVDEVTLRADKPLSYTIAEIPLPPGATLEPQRFGFAIDGLAALDKRDASEDLLDVSGDEMLSTGAVLSQQRAQLFDTWYAVPVERLEGTKVLRHLVRFGLRGSFVLPATRYWAMYQPAKKAYEARAAKPLVIQ